MNCTRFKRYRALPACGALYQLMTETQPKKSDFSECLLLQMTKIAGYGGGCIGVSQYTPPYPHKIFILEE